MSKAVLFVNYLEEIGLLPQLNAAALAIKFEATTQDKDIVFELTSYIQQLSASSQYDLSSRVYQHWLRNNYIPVTSSQERNGFLDNDIKRNLPIDPHTKIGVLGTTTNGRFSAPQSTKSTSEISKKQKRSFTASSDSQNVKKSPLMGKNKLLHRKTLSSDHNVRCLTEPAGDETKSKMEVNKTLQRRMQSPDQLNSQRSFSANQRYEKLYGQRIIHEHNRMIRKEMNDQKLLKECTFTPKINNKRLSPESIPEHLQATVFSRLSKTKTPRGDLLAFSRESREMEGVTFEPNLSKSTKTSKPSREGSITQGPAKTTERLYQDAHLKQRILQMKQEYLRDKELEECTFTPQLMTSPVSWNDTRKNSDATERLYLDSVRRHHAQKFNQIAKENDFQECTFHPRRVTMDYDARSKDKRSTIELDTDIFTRLYQSARKRQELEKEFNEEMIAIDARRLQNTNAGVNQNHQRKPSPQHEKVLKDNPSSAFGVDETQEKLSVILQKEEDAAKAFERLYDESNQRKQKISMLEQKVMRERGVTFTPMTTRSRSSLQSALQKSPVSAANKENSHIPTDNRHNILPDSINLDQLREIRSRYHNLHSS